VAWAAGAVRMAWPRKNDAKDVIPEITSATADREREVPREVARGLSNTEIAERLHMSGATAKTHVSRLLTKLGARDRARLVVIAHETGLVGAAGEEAARRPGRP
jgi:DNA-binding NarL/FixJ family response regulator